jgi:hypothetical protein
MSPIALSTFIFVFRYSIEFWAWYLITLKLEIGIPLKKTRESWFYLRLGKYLHGKVWLFLGRLYLYGSKGKSRKTFTVAPYFEMLTLAMAAGVIFLVSLFSLREIQRLSSWISSAWLIPLVLLSVLFLHPRVLQELLNRILLALRRDPIPISISYNETLRIIGVCVLSWGVVESVFILLLIPSLPFRFADFPDPFDLILSVGFLQIMKGELLKSTLSSLARYSKIDGRFYLIRLPKVFNKRELRGRLNLTRIQETLRFPLRVTTSRTQ